MLDFNQVCTWLNHFEPTHLSSKAQTMMGEIDSQLGLPAWGTPSAPKSLDKAIADYVAQIQKSSDPEEYPEGMVRLARFYYQKGGNSIEALDILKRANTVYRKIPKSDFRVAIVHWLIGYVYLQMYDTQTAHDLWKSAIEKFENVVSISKSGVDYTPDYGEFCTEKLELMWIAVLQLPEEAFSWLDEKSLSWIKGYGGGNHMNVSTLQLKNILLQRQVNDNFRAVYADLDKFHKISKESVHSLKGKLIYGEADALTVSGMLLFWMGNVPEARKKFKAAADIYLPDTHPVAIVHWLLGLMYLYPPNDKRKAVDHCEWAINGFNRVRFIADVKHDRTANDWYMEKINLLKKTLDWIESDLFS